MAVLVGKPAPDFTAAAVLGSGEIVDGFNLAKTIRWTSLLCARLN
jgi:peroxiredoxin (alkyl hydroperoxide reductase subunit C)